MERATNRATDKAGHDPVKLKLDDNADQPGVFAARQLRSRRIRDAFVDAGVALLNERSLAHLTVPDLAAHAGCSVGSFYTRFADKAAFFAALQGAYIAAADSEISGRIDQAALARCSPRAVVEHFVDLMVDLFSGPSRGVLRETLLRIAEPDNPWEPMREMGRRVRGEMHKSLADRIQGPSKRARQQQISFFFQALVGVLHNDLINDHHVFSTRDETLKPALVELGTSYLKIRARPRSG